ncbi:hypothetical protein PR048_000917 [Dryococelus australis]|uniref:Integrase catalytic domain-containing protein n=1 Tax=Dryococelus australis TaxID=614101 RepID=A0ABQ9IGV1_9NEOP|nr:hypothetical protein PR048_000917 [Dryococelus australis]
MQVGHTMREEFECKIRELLGDKADISLLTSDERHNEIVEEIKAARDKRKNGIPLSAKDNCRLKCFDVDLLDMQSEPDGDYKFILKNQDHLTKFVVLWQLKTKIADDIADVILDIFCLPGAPNILRSDNGREFCNKVIEASVAKWNGIKTVHGKPRHSQSKGSVERANQDVRDSLVAWKKDDNTSSWRTPYEGLFGVPQKNGLLDSCLSSDIAGNIDTEEQLEEYLSNLTHNFDETDTENVDEANTYEINNQQISSPMETEESVRVCIVCDQQFEEEISCFECAEYFHSTCTLAPQSEIPLCHLWAKKSAIETSRKHCKHGLQEQAERMLQTSGRSFHPSLLVIIF